MSKITSAPVNSNVGFCREDINKLAKGTGTFLFGSSIGKGILFLTQLLLAWLLGVEKFGLYNLGLAVVRIAEIISRLGLNNGGMRFVSIYKDTSPSKLKGILIAALGISLVSGCLIATIVYFTASIIAQSLFQKPELCHSLRLFCLSIPLVATMNVCSSLLQGFHTTKFTVWMREFIQPIVNVLFIIALSYDGLDLSGAIHAFIFSHFIALASGIQFLRKLFPRIFQRDLKSEYLIKPLLAYSTPLLFVGFLHYFLTWTDTLMLGIFASASDVGVYRAASQVPLLMTLVLGATNSIYAPIAADLYENRQFQRLGEVLKISTRWVTYLTVPIFIFLVFSGREIMLLFGKDYVETGSIVLVILCFGQLTNCITGGVGFTLTMTGRQKVELANSLGLVLACVMLNVILIPKFGVIGTAIATSATTVAMNLLRVMEVYMLYSIKPFSERMLSVVLPTIVSVPFVALINLNCGNIVTLVFNVTIIGVIFIVILAKCLTAEEDKHIFMSIKRKILCKFIK